MSSVRREGPLPAGREAGELRPLRRGWLCALKAGGSPHGTTGAILQPPAPAPTVVMETRALLTHQEVHSIQVGRLQQAAQLRLRLRHLGAGRPLQHRVQVEQGQARVVLFPLQDTASKRVFARGRRVPGRSAEGIWRIRNDSPQHIGWARASQKPQHREGEFKTYGALAGLAWG